MRKYQRWFRRYWLPWFQTYPWHINTPKLLGWQLELGRHWRTERLYFVAWNGLERMWFMKAGANVG